MDELSWAREGAVVTGMDFSMRPSRRRRRWRLNARIEARFIEGNLYDLPDVLEGHFDIVLRRTAHLCGYRISLAGRR